MNLINAITQIKAQTKDKAKQQTQQNLIQQLNTVENALGDKNILVQALMTALDHLKTSKEANQITALRTITLLIPLMVNQEIDVATSLMLAFIFTDYQIQADAICDEFLLFCQALIDNPTLFINDLQVLFVQKIAGILANPKISLLRKSNFERFNGAFLDFLVQNQQSLLDVYIEYLQQSITGQAQEFRLCQKQVACINPTQAIGSIYNSHAKELHNRVLSWQLNVNQLNNNIKTFSSGLARDGNRDTSMQLYNVFSGKNIKGQTLVMQGVYWYLVLSLANELAAGKETSLALLTNLGSCDNQFIAALHLLFVFLFVRAQKEIDAELFETQLTVANQYFLKDKVFSNVLFQLIGQADNIRQFLKISDNEAKQLAIPESMTLDGVLEPNAFAGLMVQREPDSFIAFLHFVSFQQCSGLFWNNKILSPVSSTSRQALLNIHTFFLNAVQSNALTTYSFDQLFAIALQLDKCNDDENVARYLQTVEAQLGKLLEVDQRPCNKLLFTNESYIYKIVANLVRFLVQLRLVPNFLNFQAIILSLLIGVVANMTKQAITNVDIQDVTAFLYENRNHIQLDKGLVQFLDAFCATYNVATDKYNAQRTTHVLDLENYFMAFLQLSAANVDKLYDKLITQIILNESQKIYDIESLFVLLRVFQTSQYRCYIEKLLAQPNRIMKRSVMQMLVNNVIFQLLMQSEISEPISNDIVHKLIYENRKNATHLLSLEQYAKTDFIGCIQSICNEANCAANQEEIASVFLQIFQFSDAAQVPITGTAIERHMMFFLQLSALTPSDGILALLAFVVRNQSILHRFEQTTKEFLARYLFEMVQNLNHGKLAGAQKQQFNPDTIHTLLPVFCRHINSTQLIIDALRACQQFIYSAKLTPIIIKQMFAIIDGLQTSYVCQSKAINSVDLVLVFDVFVVGTMLKILELLLRQQNQAKRNRLLDVLMQLFMHVKEFLNALSATLQPEFVYIFSIFAQMFKDCLENELQELYFDTILRFLANSHTMPVLFDTKFEVAWLEKNTIAKELEFKPRQVDIIANESVIRFADGLMQQVSYQFFASQASKAMLNTILDYCIEKKLYLHEIFDLLINQLFLIDKHEETSVSEDYLFESEQDQEDGASLELPASSQVLGMLDRVVKQMECPKAQLIRLFSIIFSVQHVASQRLLLGITFNLLVSTSKEIQLDLVVQYLNCAISNIDVNELSPSFWSGLFGTLFSSVVSVFDKLNAEGQAQLVDASIRVAQCLLVHPALEFYGPRCDALFLLSLLHQNEKHAGATEQQLYALMSSFLLQLTPNCAVQRQPQRKLLLGRRIDCAALSSASVFAPINAGIVPLRVGGSSAIDFNFLNASLLQFCFQTLRNIGEKAASFVLDLYRQIADNYVIESQLCGSCPMRLGNAALEFFEFTIDSCFGTEHIKNVFKASLKLLQKGKDVEQYRGQLLARLAEVI